MHFASRFAFLPVSLCQTQLTSSTTMFGKLLTLAFVAAAVAAPAPDAVTYPQAPTPSDLQIAIQNIEVGVLTVINDIAQLRPAFSDFSTTGRDIDSLRSAISSSCPPTAAPPSASSDVQAIQYLQQVQLDLNIVSEDLLTSEDATNDVCTLTNLYAAVGVWVQSGTATATPTDCTTQEDQCRTAPDANQAFCSSQAAGCKSTCQTAFDTCATAPNANHAFCASQYAGCLGYNPFDTTSSTAPPSTTSSTSSSSASPTATDCTTQEDQCRTAPNANQAFCSAQAAGCKSTCQTAFNTCSTAPNANHAFCASQYAGCLGYNPFTTASSTASSTVPPSGSSSTSSSSALPTPTDCTTQENQCRTAPNANQAFCSAQAAQCQDTCANTFDACATAPDANHAFCASQYAGCLGCNPFGSTEANNSCPTTATTTSSSSTSTTSSSATPTPTDCTTQEDQCRTAPDANESFCSYQAAQCQDTCTDLYDQCITAPDRNFSYCGSQYAACLGYNPFTGNTTSTSSTITAGPTTTAFACNPAHSYPSPVTCISTDGSLTLFTPTSTTASTTVYSKL